MNEIRDQWAAAVLSDRSITNACARTAWAIREYVNAQGRTIVSNTTLARDTSQDLRFVRRHIALLVARGYLARFDRGGNGYGRSNTAITQLMVPGLFEHQSPLPLVEQRGVMVTPTLDKKRGVISAEKGGHGGQKGGSPRPPRTHVTHITPGAAARATPTGSRAAPAKTIGTPTDPLVLRRMQIRSLASQGYDDNAIASACGASQDEIDVARGYCMIA